MHGVQTKLNRLEDRSLESNLILHGIEEQSPDNLEARIKKVYNAISSTINRDTPTERLVVAHEVEIVRTRCLGKADQNKTRPLSVEFASKYDAEQIFANRFSLEQGIYVDREFCFETEKARRLLRPVLKAAKGIKEYNRKCRLEGNQLVLDGKRYTKDTLDQLPRNLDVMKITTKSDEKSLGFFGELCPLSNFYPSSFEFNGINYHSTEQLIQHQKAKLFSDKRTEHSILTAKSPIECKKLSRNISNFNYKQWMENAKELCKDGIEAKFVQNPRIMQALLETGHKKLVECTKDYLWGTGVPLNDPQCLTEKCWKGQGLQGIMLQEIRQKHMQIAQLVLPTINQWHSQGPPQLLQPGVVPCDPVINSSGNTIAVTQPQTPTSQAPHSQPIALGNVVAAPMGKIGWAQNTSISAAAEPSIVP